MTSVLPFPSSRPEAYQPLASEPAFDAVRHLALEGPARTWTLNDFGYDADTIDKLIADGVVT